MASSLVAAMEKEWNEQILNVPDSGSVFSLFEKQTSSIPLLSEAGRFYVDMKGKTGDKRFERYTSRVVSEVIGLVSRAIVLPFVYPYAWATPPPPGGRESGWGGIG